LTLLLGRFLPLPGGEDEEGNDLVGLDNQPKVAMALTMRSGPVVLEAEYEVDPENAREFYEAVSKLESVRKRIGGFDWSLSRDIANPAIWIEHFHCPTWGDYLRMRDRYTQTDLELQQIADSYCRAGKGRTIRRRLERPYGSVRWKAESPDPFRGTVDFVAP
jgi:hypothetical protein